MTPQYIIGNLPQSYDEPMMFVLNPYLASHLLASGWFSCGTVEYDLHRVIAFPLSSGTVNETNDPMAYPYPDIEEAVDTCDHFLNTLETVHQGSPMEDVQVGDLTGELHIGYGN